MKEFHRGEGRRCLVRNAARAGLPSHVSPAGKRGRMVVMAGRQAQPLFPLGPFYVKRFVAVRFRHVQRVGRGAAERAAEDINRWLAEKKLRGA